MSKNGKLNLPLSRGLRVAMYLIAFFMWPVGFIGGIVLLMNNNGENSLFGKKILVFSAVMMVVSIILGRIYNP